MEAPLKWRLRAAVAVDDLKSVFSVRRPWDSSSTSATGAKTNWTLRLSW